MDLHVYRNSQDRWHDLKSAARERGAVLALNALTFDELVQRITPDVTTATAGQRLAVLNGILNSEGIVGAVYDRAVIDRAYNAL